MSSIGEMLKELDVKNFSVLVEHDNSEIYFNSYTTESGKYDDVDNG